MVERWGFFANMFGSHGPLRLDENGLDKSGDFGAGSNGLNSHDGYLHYAHTDKRKVLAFARGYRSAQKMLRNFSNGPS